MPTFSFPASSNVSSEVTLAPLQSPIEFDMTGRTYDSTAFTIQKKRGDGTFSTVYEAETNTAVSFAVVDGSAVMSAPLSIALGGTIRLLGNDTETNAVTVDVDTTVISAR